MNKKLTKILQPLVDLVPKFESLFDAIEFSNTNFPCGSKSAAAIVSLSKWKKGHNAGCALCYECEYCRDCPLDKVESRGACTDNSFYAKAMKGDTQPLIDALELASVYALVDEFREKCEATVDKIRSEENGDNNDV